MRIEVKKFDEEVGEVLLDLDVEAQNLLLSLGFAAIFGEGLKLVEKAAEERAEKKK